MKHVLACLSASKDRECRSHHCGSPLKLVEATLYVGNTLQSRINRLGSAVKHVLACLSANKLWRPCEARATMFMCGKHPTKLY